MQIERTIGREGQRDGEGFTSVGIRYMISETRNVPLLPIPPLNDHGLACFSVSMLHWYQGETEIPYEEGKVREEGGRRGMNKEASRVIKVLYKDFLV